MTKSVAPSLVKCATQAFYNEGDITKPPASTIWIQKVRKVLVLSSGGFARRLLHDADRGVS
jgi:hypothetical protein